MEVEICEPEDESSMEEEEEDEDFGFGLALSEPTTLTEEQMRALDMGQEGDEGERIVADLLDSMMDDVVVRGQHEDDVEIVAEVDIKGSLEYWVARMLLTVANAAVNMSEEKKIKAIKKPTLRLASLADLTSAATSTDDEETSMAEEPVSTVAADMPACGQCKRPISELARCIWETMQFCNVQCLGKPQAIAINTRYRPI